MICNVTWCKSCKSCKLCKSCVSYVSHDSLVTLYVGKAQKDGSINETAPLLTSSHAESIDEKNTKIQPTKSQVSFCSP